MSKALKQQIIQIINIEFFNIIVCKLEKGIQETQNHAATFQFLLYFINCQDLQSVGMTNVGFEGIDGFPERTSSKLSLPHSNLEKIKL